MTDDHREKRGWLSGRTEFTYLVSGTSGGNVTTVETVKQSCLNRSADPSILPPPFAPAAAHSLHPRFEHQVVQHKGISRLP